MSPRARANETELANQLTERGNDSAQVLKESDIDTGRANNARRVKPKEAEQNGKYLTQERGNYTS